MIRFDKGESSCVDCDNQYYNVVIPHDYSTERTFTNAIYSKSTTEPILDRPEDYYLSIISYEIPTSFIPLFVAEPLDINDTSPEPLLNYAVTLENSAGVIRSKNLVLINEFTNPRAPNERYWIYVYDTMVQMVNKAFRDLVAEMITDLELPSGTLPPYLLFSPNSGLFSFYAPEADYNTGDPGDIPLNPTVKVYLNNTLAAFFDSFPSKTRINDSARRYQILFYEKLGLNEYLKPNNPDPAIKYLIMVQDYRTTFYWNQIRELHVLSSLPTRREYVDIKYGAVDTTRTNLTVQENVLTIFRVFPGANTSGTVRQSIIELPIENNYIDLYGVTPIRTINLQFFWVDARGERYQHKLQRGENIKLRFLFKRRNNNY
jgi:hypothetical protein